MGQIQDHALGRNRKFYAQAESSFGTWIKPSATHAAKIINMVADRGQERNDRMDSRASRSVLERITGRKTGSWSLESYLLPSGAAGTAPDLSAVLKAAFGSETLSASTSVTYGLSALQSALGSLAMYEHMNDTLAKTVMGAWVDSLTLSVSGASEPRLSVSGGCADVVHTGASTVNGAVTSNADVTVDEPDNFEVDSLVAFTGDDNTGAGYKVTAKSGSTLTLETTVSVSDGVAIFPFAPSETTAGSPVNGITGSIAIDSTSIPITGFEVTLANNNKAITDEAFKTKATDYIPGFREVTGSITARARKDLIQYFNGRNGFTTKDLAIVCGSTAGSILTVNINQAEFEFGSADVPESEEGTLNIPFKALGSSGEDEVEFVFT